MSGKIDLSALYAKPEQSELETAKYFADLGKDIRFIRPSMTPNQHTPDIVMDGVEWEIKCPEGNSRRTLETHIRKAVTQSHYIIIDLRWIKIPEKMCLAQLELHFKTKPSIKNLWAITKNHELIKFSKKS